MDAQVQFFRFQPEIPFSGKFGKKNQTCQFKLKFGTSTNSNMQVQWWCSLFPFFSRIITFEKTKLNI